MAARQATAEPSDPDAAAPPLDGFVPLENGDRLTRCEFERRYTARPDIRKAELIEGVVHVPSPVRARGHAGPVGVMTTWLVTYSASTPGVSVLVDATVRLDRDNEPQPDVLLRIESESGGQSRLSADDYVEGPPELIVEVAASSAAYDLYDKLRVIAATACSNTWSGGFTTGPWTGSCSPTTSTVSRSRMPTGCSTAPTSPASA